MNRRYFRRAETVLASLLLAALPALGQKSPEIPSGISIHVRMIDSLSSERDQTGDTFRGALDQPIEVNGRELYPKGADVVGRVTDVHPTGRLSEPGELDLVVSTVISGTVATSIYVEPLVIKGESHAKSNVTKIGGAAGTGAAAATGKKPAIVDSEAVLTFVTSSASAPAVAPPAGPSSNDAASTPPPAALPAVSAATSDPGKEENDSPPLFTLRDRRTIRSCVGEHASDLPESATQRPELPSGAERKIQRGENLPSEVLNHAQSLPLACEEQLAPLPGNLERVLYGGRALLIDSNGRVLDMFNLDQNQ
jgi:hypothetical protein